MKRSCACIVFVLCLCVARTAASAQTSQARDAAQNAKSTALPHFRHKESWLRETSLSDAFGCFRPCQVRSSLIEYLPSTCPCLLHRRRDECFSSCETCCRWHRGTLSCPVVTTCQALHVLQAQPGFVSIAKHVPVG